MTYLIVRRELHGKLSWALQEEAPRYMSGEFAQTWKRDNELVVELEPGLYSLVWLKTYIMGGYNWYHPIIRRVVNWPKERPQEV